MGATLDALYRLQTLENQLLDLRRKIRARQRAVRGCRKRIEDIEATLAAKREQLKRDQADADRQELDRKAREADIARHREALNRAKTNKEYAAILTQLNTEKADNAKIEDRVLAMLGAVDQARKSIQEYEELKTKEIERLRELEAAATEYEASVRAEVQALEERREDEAEHISPDIVRTFIRVAEHHDGEAMAVVVQANPRRAEYVCGGCNMSITLEHVSALRSRDEIQTCNNCGRILYLDEAVRTSR